MQTSPIRQIIQFAFFIAILFAVATVIVYAGRAALPLLPLKYEMQLRHDLPNGHVEILPKPHDCDFLKAPLGSKNCHFEREINLLNAKGELIGGEGVTADGKRVVTKPEGVVSDVTVFWIKVED